MNTAPSAPAMLSGCGETGAMPRPPTRCRRAPALCACASRRRRKLGRHSPCCLGGEFRHAADDAATTPLAAGYRIAIRLTRSHLITAGHSEGADKAAALGHAVGGALTDDPGERRCSSPRLNNPETLVSVDLVPDNSIVA